MKYIWVRIVKAEPREAWERSDYRGRHELWEPGYSLACTDGWWPKDEFEATFLPLSEDASKPKVSQQMVDDFISKSKVEVTTMGEKNTVVRAVLPNGFEIVESSACVCPENYDEELGVKICMEKIKDKVWYLLGFLLQTAVNGFGGSKT